jgi:hypothetical protein
MWHTSVHIYLIHHLLLHILYLLRVVANSTDIEGQAKKKPKPKKDLELLILLDQLYLYPNLLLPLSPCILAII